MPRRRNGGMQPKARCCAPGWRVMCCPPSASAFCRSIWRSPCAAPRSACPTRTRVRDGLIAATALVHGMTVVTRNVTDFAATGAPTPQPLGLSPKRIARRLFALRISVYKPWNRDLAARRARGHLEQHDHRQRHSPHFPRFLRPQRPHGRAVQPAGAAQRSDADVRQLRAWCSSRTSSPATRSGPTRAPPRRRNACAPAASTTTSRMSATRRGTTPSSRCWAISRSATISRTTRSSSPGS